MVSLKMSMSCSVSNRFLNSSLLFHLYVQFNVVHSHSMATSNFDLVDDCFGCDNVWSVC